MRTAIISDIHGNLAALEAVLHNIDGSGVEQVHCLGDVVGYGPFPNECVALVRQRCSLVIKGNHDSGLIGETAIQDFNQYGQRALRWTETVITPDNLQYLTGLPLRSVIGDITLVHASPDDPAGWNYVFTVTAAKASFSAFDTAVCFIGHTHVPVVIGEDMSINTFSRSRETREHPSKSLVNVGSVGQPRDGDPRAAFGIIDTEAWTYDLVRVEYEIEKTAAAILDAGLPEFLARRLFKGV